MSGRLDHPDPLIRLKQGMTWDQEIEKAKINTKALVKPKGVAATPLDIAKISDTRNKSESRSDPPNNFIRS